MTGTKAIDKIWYSRGPVPTPLGLAAQLGWFLDEFRHDGIGVYTLQDEQYRDLKDAHYDHRLASSFRQGSSAPAIWTRASGRETRLIGLNWIDEDQSLITLPDRKITTLKQLRGRRIALPRSNRPFDQNRAAALRGILVALDFAGLSAADVELVDIADTSDLVYGHDHSVTFARHAGVAKALQDGLVDVIFVRGAQGAKAAEELRARLLIDLRVHPDPLLRANNGTPRPLTVDAELLAQRPDLVVRFLSRVAGVGPWASLHPAETMRYLARESHTEERHVRVAYGSDLHLRQYTDLDERSVRGLESYKDFLLQHGFISRDVDIRQWIDSEPLEQIRRMSAVTYA